MPSIKEWLGFEKEDDEVMKYDESETEEEEPSEEEQEETEEPEPEEKPIEAEE
jgi:hypothetical protein